MKVILLSCGNPDMGQNPDRPYMFCEPGSKVEVDSFAEASKVCRKFISDNGLGSGHWAGGRIFNDKDEWIATVSYNGRVWDKKSKEEISIA